MKKAKIIGSILTMIPFIGICVGTTYALFTSEASTSVVVTSGNVSVDASISNLSLYSPKAIKPEDGSIIDDTNIATGNHFGNNGSATIDASGKLSLLNMTPGDKASFKVNITNTSNVTIKYRVLFDDVTDYPTPKPSEILFDKLEIKVDGDDVSKNLVPWTLVEVGETIDSLDVSVELPTIVTPEYSGLSCNLKFTIEAVQGNAQTANPQYLNFNVSAACLAKLQINDGAVIDVTEYFNDPIEIHTGDVIKADPVLLRRINIESFTTDPSTTETVFDSDTDTIYSFTVESGKNYNITFFPYAS